MRICRVTAYRIRIPFKTTFSHALHSRGSTDTVVLIPGADDGNVGCGEVLPRPYLTGETIERVWQDEIPALAGRWLGRAFTDRSDVLAALGGGLRAAGRNLATFAGWELALLDLAGKTFGFAAGDVLSDVTGPELPPGVVIDFSIRTKDLEKRCMLLRIAGRRHVKVKVGADDDLRRL
jgi:L-alanine-DL-glutamate epimerase-like enolase superfamily enzyme